MGKYKDYEKHLQYMRDYNTKHKERLKQQQKEWRKKHKLEILERVNKWRKDNKEKVNRNAAKSASKIMKEIRIEILEHLGNRCIKCGFSDPRALHIDHVHGGGRKEVKQFSNYLMYLKYVLEQLKNDSKEYQLLCANHNAIKRCKNREQPISKYA